MSTVEAVQKLNNDITNEENSSGENGKLNKEVSECAVNGAVEISGNGIADKKSNGHSEKACEDSISLTEEPRKQEVEELGNENSVTSLNKEEGKKESNACVPQEKVDAEEEGKNCVEAKLEEPEGKVVEEKNELKAKKEESDVPKCQDAELNQVSEKADESEGKPLEPAQEESEEKMLEKAVVENKEAETDNVEERVEKTEDIKENKLMPGDEAAQLFLQGKRDYAIKDYGAAVVALAKACELLSAIHGELADELGDVYYLYGKALFANATSASTVLGDKIGKVKEDSGEDDEEEDDEEPNSTKTEEEGQNKTEAEDRNKTEEEAMETETVPLEDSSEKSIEMSKEEKEDTEATADVDGEAEDADDLQLSWEVLEMAKVILSRHSDDPEKAIKLSEVYLTLGENGLESERYDTAIVDIQTCLEIQRKHLKPDDRRIAETLYELGVAYSVSENYDDAITNFEASVTQLEMRLTTLEETRAAGKKHPDGEDRDAFYSVDGEVDEINSAIKDIREKIIDMQESKKHLKNEIVKQMSSAFGESSGVNGAASTTTSTNGAAETAPSGDPAAVNDITHLVRKKRKNEDEEEAAAEKKAKVNSA